MKMRYQQFLRFKRKTKTYKTFEKEKLVKFITQREQNKKIQKTKNITKQKLIKKTINTSVQSNCSKHLREIISNNKNFSLECAFSYTHFLFGNILQVVLCLFSLFLFLLFSLASSR